MVLELARAFAKKPFAAPANELPDPFAGLTYEQYVGIKTKPGAAVWAGENKGFTIEPLHRGPIFTTPVDLFVIENQIPRRIAYDRRQFRLWLGESHREARPTSAFPAFASCAAMDGAIEAEVAMFQGASFYRAVAPGQNLGVTARGLAIRTADPRGEEFPIFRSFWIERPALGDNALVIHALLDSQSVDRRLSLHPAPRRGDHHRHGNARCFRASTSIISALRASRALRCSRRSTVAAPTTYEPWWPKPTACKCSRARSEWLWRPVSNRDNLQVSAFVDANPKGFGFLQRNRDIGAYQDDDQHWEKRPSLWIEPLGEWGEGAVQLVEIPSESEINDNIVAYWRPKQPLVAGKEATFAYRQFWCWEPPTRSPLAIATDARGGRSPWSKMRRFVVVFSGDIMADPQRIANLKAALTTSPGSATNIRTFCNPQAKTCRVVFDVDPGGETFCELRLVLQSGDDPISETWLYRWTS